MPERLINALNYVKQTISAADRTMVEDGNTASSNPAASINPDTITDITLPELFD